MSALRSRDSGVVLSLCWWGAGRAATAAGWAARVGSGCIRAV